MISALSFALSYLTYSESPIESKDHFNRPDRPVSRLNYKVNESYLDDVEEFTKTRKAFGLLTKEDEEWAEEQQDFFGMYTFRTMMRAGSDGRIRWRNYEDAAEHIRKMPKLIRPNYIGSGWTFFGSRAISGPSYAPLAGRVNNVAYSYQDPNIFYVAASSGGAFKTTNHGAGFLAGMSDTWDYLYTSTVEVDPFNSNRVYVGCGDYPGGWGYGMGLMKSSDGGSTWTNYLRTELDGCEISDIWVDPNNTSNIVVTAGRGTYSATGAGIWRSVDYGIHWTQVKSESTGNGYSKVECSVESGGVRYLYASHGANGTIVRSTDGGVQWTTLALQATGMTSVAVSTVSREVVFAYVGTPGSPQDTCEVYKSTDHGTNWSVITGNLGNLSGTNNDMRQVDYNYAFGCMNTLANGTGTDILFLGMVDPFVLKNPTSNTTWTYLNNGPNGRYIHADQHGFRLHPTQKNTCMISNDGGIYEMTYDSTFQFFSFTNLNNSLRVSEHTGIDPHPNASVYPNYMLSGLWHNGTAFCSTDPFDWQQENGADGMLCFIDDINPNIQFTSIQGLGEGPSGNIGFRATTNAWTGSASLNTTPAFANEVFAFVTPVDEIPGLSGSLYFAAESLYKLTYVAGVPFWTKNIGGVDFSAVAKETATAVDAFSSANAGCYVGTSRGRLFASTNPSAGMTVVGDFGSGISCISTHPSVDEAALVCIGNGSKAGGGSGLWECTNVFAANPNWVDRTGTGATALPTIGVNWVVRDPYDPTSTWYAATDLGVFYTDDRGAHWYQASTSLGLPNATVTQLKISDNYLYAGTFGRGIWRMALRSTKPKVSTFAISETQEIGGNTLVGTVTLDVQAPPGGEQVAITSNLPSFIPNQTVTVPEGNTSYSFFINTNQTNFDAFVTVNATANGGTDSDTVTLLEVNLNGVVAPNVTGGDAGFAILVTSDRAAPTGGAVVNLSVSHPSTVQVPATVTIPEGSTFALASCTSTVRATDLVVTVTASRNSHNEVTTMTVFGVQVVGVTINPSSIWNTQSFNVDVTLNRGAPSTGYTVGLQSLNAAVAQVPGSIFIPNNATSGSVQGTSNYVSADTNVTIRATDWFLNIDRTLTVKHLGVIGFTSSPNPVVGGNSIGGGATVDRNVGSSLITIKLTSADPTKVNLPSSLSIMPNQTSGSFVAATASVSDVTDVVLTAQIGNQRVTGAFVDITQRLLPSVIVVKPSSMTVNLGNLTSGSVADLGTVNGSSVRTCKGLVPNLVVAPITVQFEGYCVIGTCSAIKLRFNSRMANAGTYTQTLDPWNWVTGTWDTVDVRNDVLNLTFTSRELNGTAPLNRWLDISGQLRARYRVKQTGISPVPVWCHEVDEAVWLVTP